MASVSVEVVGLGAAIKGLEQFSRLEAQTLFRDLGALQVKQTKARLKKRKGNTDGTYPASKRAQHDGGDTLWDTGHMMQAFKPTGWTRSEVTMTIGSAFEMKKAVWNQYGTKAFTVAKGKAFPITAGGSKKILAWSRKKAATPARPLFGVSPSDARGLREFIVDGIDRLRKKAGIK